MVQLLVSHGAAANAIGEDGQRPLAKTAGHLETALTLIRLVRSCCKLSLAAVGSGTRATACVQALHLSWAPLPAAHAHCCTPES